ncbi:MAG TPA: hypothetical protein VHD35_00740 [Chitinophagaceae bacterium]|nr:hypothetical protein [Chitinophagaceae bacterium]
MPAEFEMIFDRLKQILKKHSGQFTIKPDSDSKYGLYAKVGPATLKAWKGKMKSPIMPVAWVEVGKAYVSYHLMPVYMNPKLQSTISKDLKARMQGKSCFNFKYGDEKIFEQLDELTGKSIDAFRKLGYIAD